MPQRKTSRPGQASQKKRQKKRTNSILQNDAPRKKRKLDENTSVAIPHPSAESDDEKNPNVTIEDASDESSDDELVSLATKGTEKLAKKTKITYTPIEGDRTDLIAVKMIKDGRNIGHGVYATQLIRAETPLGMYAGKKMKSVNEKSHYSMTVAPDVIYDADKQGNFVRYVNHSTYQYNCIFESVGEGKDAYVVLIPIKDIKPGEQLLVCYGTEIVEDKKFYVLDPNDTYLSARKYVQANKDFYQLHKISTDYPALDIKQKDSVYVSRIGAAILENKQLARIKATAEEIEKVHLRFIKTKNGEPKNLNEYDTVNPLMAAAYLGQVKNVNWLLDNTECNKNAQQSTSANTTLHFAIRGVCDGKNTEENCLSIFQLFISRKVNLKIQNKEEEIFLLPAMLYLSQKTVKAIITELAKNKKLNTLFSVVNDHNDDIVMFAIRHKKFEILEHLFYYYPEYCQKYIGGKCQGSYQIKDMQQRISNYSLPEILCLKKMLLRQQLSSEIAESIFDLKQIKPKNQNLSLLANQNEDVELSAANTQSKQVKNGRLR